MKTKPKGKKPRHPNDTAVTISRKVASVIHRRRLEKRFTQMDLAKKTGLHRTYISDVERGYRNISVQTLCAIAAALEVPCSELIRLAETN